MNFNHTLSCLVFFICIVFKAFSQQCNPFLDLRDSASLMITTTDENVSFQSERPILPVDISRKNSHTIEGLEVGEEYELQFYHRKGLNQPEKNERLLNSYSNYLDSYVRAWVEPMDYYDDGSENFFLSGFTTHENNWIRESWVFVARQSTVTLNLLGVDKSGGYSYGLSYHYDETSVNNGFDGCIDFLIGQPYDNSSIYEYFDRIDLNNSTVIEISNLIVSSIKDECNIDGILNEQTSFSPQAGKYVLSGWVKEDVDDPTVTSYITSAIEVKINGSEVETFIPTGAIIDGWQKIEGVFDIPSNGIHLGINLKNNYTDGSTNVYFDDIRVHPFDGNMKSFVYDPESQRLMAELDENNYATFYEYDQEGGLVRVKKETERGIQTIQETRSATKINTSN